MAATPAGPIRPYFSMISAATAAAAGVAMLVPAAKKYTLFTRRLPGLITKSNTKQGAVITPDGIRGIEQTALPGSRPSPPGAAKSITDWPKSVYDAGSSKSGAPNG